ncbi:MAG: DUF4838 domain-containing protein [Opitutae bacterium]|nr:DUF4838 domain-containing protein [Opitutae bacterium]
MNRLRARFVWFAAIGSLFAGLALWQAAESRHPGDFIAFTADGYACPIYVDPRLGDAGRRAAGLLQQTLASAADRSPASFPIRPGDGAHTKGRGVFLAAQEAGPPGKLDFPAAYFSGAGRLSITSRSPETLEPAVSWFLEKELGAHWFIPGALGVQVPRRNTFSLPVKTEQWSPSFVSRNLSVGGTPEAAEWFARNRLNALLEHGHSMGAIFKREDLLKTPELAPLINGKRFQPRVGDTNSWQPNLASPLAAPYAANVLKQWLRESPARLSVPLCMNDTVGYDQSPETAKLVGNRGWFRGKPDYSNLVFGFVNNVAREVAREFPDRYVGTYAYDWTENAPDFPVEPNVVPFLTADRTKWFDPKFAAEDRALIKRWVAAGPRIVGLYDYLYGSTFQVPRPAIYAVSESIPFAYDAGVRAYYAESSPNWGLDGPKAWLVAQLLWNAKQNPADLLDTYYREFWQEAAAPMREFFAQCDAQWRHQPLPSYWLKYFKDEQQHLLFPAAIRQRLRAELAAAARLARSDAVRERLRMVSESFAVTETFADFCERREALIRLLLQPQAAPAELLALTREYLEAKRRFTGQSDKTRREFPFAVLPVPRELTRDDPAGSAVYRLGRSPLPAEMRPAIRTLCRDFSLPPELAAEAKAPAPRLVSADPTLAEVQVTTAAGPAALDWTKPGAWRGYGLPAEHRMATLVPASKGHAVRLTGCLEETFWQWMPAEGGALYRATARVKARVSPGTMTFLVVYFTDATGKFADLGTIQRLPVGEWREEVELSVVARAPRHSRRVWVAVRTVNQVEGDYAEFSQIGLARLEVPARTGATPSGDPGLN